MVYLIHFDKKLKHAQHYIGFVEKNLEARLQRHRSGAGAKILKALKAAGIEWHLAMVWPKGDRTFERTLKNRKNTKQLCPICKNHTL